MRKSTVLKVFSIISISMALFTACKDDNKQQQDNNKKAFLSLMIPFMSGPVVDYSANESSQRGRLMTAQKIWDLPRLYMDVLISYSIKKYFTDLNASEEDMAVLKPEYGCVYYAITYETLDLNGDIITASGGLFVPRKEGALPLLAYCHGTNFSTDTTGDRLQAGLFMGRGFMAVAPDYLGYGASDQIDHSYLMASRLASSTVDIIRAAKKFAEYNSIALNGKLFITGVSEGGYAAMATVREIELNYAAAHPITAAAPISGTYDLRATMDSFIDPDRTFTQHVSLPCLGFVISVYNQVYGYNKQMSYYFQEPYAGYFTEDRFPRTDSKEIRDQIPMKSSEFLNADFLASYNTAGGELDLKASFSGNNVYEFVPLTNLRMYGGEGDTVVQSFNINTAYDYFIAHGAQHVDRVILDASYGEHEYAIFHSLIRVIDWFLTL